MDLSLMQIVLAVLMAAVTVALVVAYRRYLTANAERRMLTMIDSLGLDPAIATSGDLETIMSDIRKRCQSCTSEDVCERWLTCDEKSDNDFCPNLKAFEVLKRYS